MSKEKRASTSVDTLPGTIFSISFPNSTSNRSNVASTLSSRSFPYANDQIPSHPERSNIGKRAMAGGWWVWITYMFLAILHSNINEFGILRLLGGSQDQRRIRGGVLGFVFVNCGEVSRITNHCCASRFQLFE